jgi:hypothetical protein
MDYYGLYSNEGVLPEEGTPEGTVLKQAVKKSRGGTLTNTVQPGAASTLPQTIAGYRQREAALYKQGSDLYNAEPDMTELQAYARTRGQEGEGAMLNALAAQFAGESFQPVQAQYLKRAAAAQDPMKVGGGMLTADGKFIKDPFAAQDKKAEFLLRQAQAYGQMANQAETRADQQAYRERQDAFMNELRAYMAQTGRIQADAARTRADAAAGGGELGGGTATQVGSGPNREPIFKMRDGRLFTYDQQGAATVYTGPVLPKADSSGPDQDERKAAGYMQRIDQGLRLLNIITQETPSAAKPGATSTAMSRIPVVGNMASNMITPEARQRVEAAQLDMLDAALTLATGAAYTKEQLEGLSKSYFTQIGDDPKTIADKRQRLAQIIETARIRAGRALPGAGGGAAPGGGFNPQDPLGVRSKGQ